jgi:hypothetical protein
LSRRDVSAVVGEIGRILAHSVTRHAIDQSASAGAMSFRLGATLPVWFIDAPAVDDAPGDGRLAEIARPSRRLHVQLHVNNSIAGYVRLTRIDRASELAVAAVTVSTLASRIDTALRQIDIRVRRDVDARLLMVPSTGIRALWLVSRAPRGTDRLLIVASRDERQTATTRLLEPRAFLGMLRSATHSCQRALTTRNKMNIVRSATVLAMSLLISSRGLSAQQAGAAICDAPPTGTGVIEAGKKSVKMKGRITPKTEVRLCMKGFNYVLFEPVVTTDVKEIAGYAYLEGLWSQVPIREANIGGGGRTTAQSPFLNQLALWRDKVSSSQLTLQQKIAKVWPRVYLDAHQRDTLRANLAELPRQIDALEELRRQTSELIFKQYPMRVATSKADSIALQTLDSAHAAARRAADALARLATANPASEEYKRAKAADSAAAERTRDALIGVEERGLSGASIADAYYAQELYDAQLVVHEDIVGKLRLLFTRGGHTANGRMVDLAPQKSGNLVTVTIKAKAVDQSNNPRIQAAIDSAGTAMVSYYVQSVQPLSFHAGGAYTRLTEFDYEAVAKGLAGRDAFQQIAKPANGGDVIAFMTLLPEQMISDRNIGIGPTIGTGVKDLGKRLYLGATLKVSSRFMLTAGVFSKEVTESDGRALSATEPNLFDGIQRVTAWGKFLGLSVTPF